MLVHNHTRSDHPQPVSPRIPRVRTVPREMNCNPAIEERIRSILTWNAGECGLISDSAVDVILGYHFDNLVTISDLNVLCTHEVYSVLIIAIADERERRSELRRLSRQ
jgi:hypothetical protein